MGTESAIARVEAKKPTAINGSETTITAINGSGSSGWFSDTARKLWGNKAAALIEHYCGAPERTCHRWVRGQTDISSEALRLLLWSPQGSDVLTGLMRGCKQRWWAELQRARECAAAYEARREQIEMDV